MRMKRNAALTGLASGLLALAATFSASYILRVEMNFRTINASVVAVLLWFGSYEVIRRALGCLDRRLAVVSAVMGLALAFALVVGSTLYQFGDARLAQGKTWFGVLCAAPLTASAVALFLRRFPSARLPEPRWLTRLARRLPEGRRLFLLFWALVFLAWVPGLIASYPGVYGYDCVYQMDNYLTGQVMDCHPVAHTYLLGFCVATLGDLMGSREAGMCVYSVAQMLALSAALAAVLCRLKRRGASGLALLASLLLAMFLPINAIMSFSGTKDVLFAAALVGLTLCCFEAAREPDRLRSRGFCVRLMACALGMMLFRNTGVYLFAVVMLAGVAALRGQRGRVMALLLAGVAFFAAYDMLLCPYVLKTVEIDNPQEALSVPCVQLARAARDGGDALAEADRAAIEAYLPDWRNYTDSSWGIADPVKNTFNVALYHQDEAAFFRLWLRVGLRCPQAYANAFLRLNLGLWYPDLPYPDWVMYHPYFEYDNTSISGDWLLLERSTPSGLRWLARFYRSLANGGSYQRVPVLSLIMSAGVMTWLTLLFAAWAAYARRWRLLFAAAAPIALIAGLLFGPVTLLRYVYPLFLCAPVLLCEMRATDERRNEA